MKMVDLLMLMILIHTNCCYIYLDWTSQIKWKLKKKKNGWEFITSKNEYLTAYLDAINHISKVIWSSNVLCGLYNHEVRFNVVFFFFRKLVIKYWLNTNSFVCFFYPTIQIGIQVTYKALFVARHTLLERQGGSKLYR